MWWPELLHALLVSSLAAVAIGAVLACHWRRPAGLWWRRDASRVFHLKMPARPAKPAEDVIERRVAAVERGLQEIKAWKRTDLTRRTEEAERRAAELRKGLREAHLTILNAVEELQKIPVASAGMCLHEHVSRVHARLFEAALTMAVRRDG